jgi:hypothetical protein
MAIGTYLIILVSFGALFLFWLRHGPITALRREDEFPTKPTASRKAEKLFGGTLLFCCIGLSKSHALHAAKNNCAEEHRQEAAGMRAL